MPLYEYQCAKCGRFEVIRKFSDAPLAACPTCGGPVQKLLSAPAIQFKGTGWYVTDYARSGSSGEKKPGKDGASGSSESGSKDSSSRDSGSKDAGSKDGGKADAGGASKSGGSKSDPA